VGLRRNRSARAVAYADRDLRRALLFSDAQRTKEIGIRVARWGVHSSVTFLVLRQSMRLAGFGSRWAALLALGVSRLFAAHLVGINVFDGLAYGAECAAVIAASAAAAYFPSRRAARIDRQSRCATTEQTRRVNSRRTRRDRKRAHSSRLPQRGRRERIPHSLRLGISALNGQALHWDRPPALHRASMEYFLLFVA